MNSDGLAPRFLVVRWARWAVLALFLCLIVVWALQVDRSNGGPDVYLKGQTGAWEVLRQATLERPGLAPMQVTLPHRIPQNSEIQETANYLVPLHVQTKHQRLRPLGICVPRWSLTAEVLLDGVRLAASPAGLAGVRDYTRPQFVALPAGLALGQHTLQVRLTTLPDMDPGLSEVWFGDGEPLRYACGQFAESKRDRAFGAAFMMGAMGLVGLFLWRLLKDSSALFFSLMALAWVLHYVHLTSVWAPMSLDTWSLLYFATRTAFVLPMFLFCLRFAQARRPWLERGLWLYYGGMTLLLVLLPASLRSEWLTAMAVTSLLIALYFLWKLLGFALREAGIAGQILAITLAFVIGSHMLDLARWLGLAPYGGASLSYVAVPMLFLSFGLLLLERLLRHTRREEAAADLLRQQVEAQRAEIQRHFETQQRQREQLAVAEERRRIVQDMHDGLGSQLVSASAVLSGPRAVPPQQAVQLINQALLDLRNVLDVLATEPTADPNDAPVSTLLGALRWRMAPVLQSQGVALHWRADLLPADFLPQDSQRLHLLRLLQEVFANILKHAQAKQVTVDITADKRGIRLTVRDDGQGFTPGVGRGVGLQSMQRRALHLGADLTIEGGPQEGTTVQLVWPPSGGGVSA